MGSFYTNLHVKSSDRDKVKAAIASCQGLPAFVTEPEEGWISVYPRATESQDDEILKELASQISRSVNTGVFGFLVHDSDIFVYTFSENGQQLDNYCSDPGYFDGADKPPDGGNIEAVLKYCIPGTSSDDLANVILDRPNKAVAAAKVGIALLKKDVGGLMNSGMIWGGDSRAQALAELLGINGDRASIGYKYIRQGDIMADTSLFEHLKDGNADDELNIFKEVAGDPCLVTKMERDMARYSPEQQQHIEEMRKSMSAMAAMRGPVDHAGALGEEIRIYDDLANAGGTASGIMVVLSGTALEQKLVSPRVEVSASYSSGDEDNDYATPDALDERLWPYALRLVEERPGVWRGRSENFRLVRDISIEFYLKGLSVGSGLLTAEVTPLTGNGATPPVKFEYKVTVEEAKEPEEETDAHEVQFFGYSIVIPAGFESYEQGYCGIKGTLPNSQNTELVVGVIDSDAKADSDEHGIGAILLEIVKTQLVSSIDDLLENIRISMKIHEFQINRLAAVSLDGITVERAIWKAPFKAMSGYVMLARDGSKQIQLTAHSDNEAVLDKIINASSSFQRTNLQEGSKVSGTTGRKSDRYGDASQKAPFKLKFGLFSGRLVLLFLAYKYVLHLLPGIVVNPKGMLLFGLYFAVVWPMALRTALFIGWIALPAVRKKVLARKGEKPNMAVRILKYPLGFVLVMLSVWLLCQIAPNIIKIDGIAGLLITASIIFGINVIKFIADEIFVRRVYPGERKTRPQRKSL